MISLIIFFVGVVVTYISSLITFNSVMTWWDLLWTVCVSVIGMIGVNGVVATVCSKLLPDKCFNENSRFYTTTKKEYRFYEKLGIKKWKDKTLEMGYLNGFRKNKINEPNSPEYIERYILETNKGFLTHFVSLFASVAAVFILPRKFWGPIGVPIMTTSLLLNIIPIMILRYNMPRLKVMLKYSRRHAKD